MDIDCPAGGSRVQVAGSGSGTGSGAGTICVQGTITDTEQKRSGAKIRVRVLDGHVALGSLPGPEPKMPGDVDVPPVGDTWCAHGVAVPNSSPAGAPLTVLAWLLGGSGSGSGQEVPTSKQFFGVVNDPTADDCCVGCGSGHGTPAPPAVALAAAPRPLPPPPPPFPPGIS